LFFPKRFAEQIEAGNVLEAWSDSDWCGDKVERKNTYGYLFKFLGAPVSWCSKKQNVVALYSCEEKHIAAADATCQCLCLESLVNELKLEYVKPIQSNLLYVCLRILFSMASINT